MNHQEPFSDIDPPQLGPFAHPDCGFPHTQAEIDRATADGDTAVLHATLSVLTSAEDQDDDVVLLASQTARRFRRAIAEIEIISHSQL